MGILSRLREKLFGGVQRTVKHSNAHLSRKETELNTIGAKVVEKWFQDQINKLTILNRLYQQEKSGTDRGTRTGSVVLWTRLSSKSSVKNVIRKRRAKKTS